MKECSVRFSRLSLRVKIILLALFSGGVLGAISIPQEVRQQNLQTTEAIEEIRQILNTDFDRSVKQEVEAAFSVIQATYERQERGELTQGQAKTLAADLVRKMHYGTDGYFWIDTYEGVNVVYAGKDAEGKSRWDAKDSTGKPFIQEIIANGRKPGGGFTSYSFPRSNGTIALPKRSYSLSFGPYEWVVGSGNYIEDIEEHVQKRETELRAESRKRLVQHISITSVLIVITMLLAYFIGSNLSNQIHLISERLIEGASELRSSIGKILAVSHDLSNLSQQQAAAVQQTASAMEEISTTIRRSVDSAEQSVKISSDSREKAEEGRRMVVQMNGSMSRIMSSNDAVAQVVGQNNAKMGEVVQLINQINDKTTVINDIVFQTKLLSFNASVEAARAGEQGKGFSVVAEEVGSLAQMSGTAAKEITSLLGQSTQEVRRLVDETKTCADDIVQSANKSVHEGSQVATTCEQVLRDIVEASNTVSSAISEIAVAAKEQSTAVSEISTAINEIDHTTQVAASSGKSSAAAADELAERTKKISGLASSLESLVKGRQVLPKFEWVKEYSIGIDDMDQQHIELIRRMNILANELENGRGARSNRASARAFNDLAQYTRQHFSEEEQFMKSFGYDTLSAHQKIHHSLLDKLNAFAAPVENGTVEAAALMEFLIDWLIHHILNSDKMYASSYRMKS